MREVFELVRLMEEVGGKVGDYVSPDVVDLGEGYDVVRVSCDNVDFVVIDKGGVELGDRLIGVDSHTSVLRFAAFDVHVVTGALVGRDVYLVPGVQGVRWLGLKLRFRLDNADALDRYSGIIYVKSRYLGRYFDGSYNDEAIRDEVRLHVELRLINIARELSGFILIDGPVFPTPRILGMEGNEYSSLYWGLVKDRVEALRGLRAVGVVKRLGQSHYLARCLGEVYADDYTLAVNKLTPLLGNGGVAAIGPVRIEAGDYGKYCWYVASRLGRRIDVVRVEGLSEDVVEVGRDYVALTMTVGGTAMSIHIADRVARRLNASAVNLISSISPLGITYEGLETIREALSELGG
ncbi:DNA double-strand break repair nuclease NurA [Vulcanisaeta distributa]|uniref:NurA domain protein n=1 Tax=Vulcanisaeta distributa (strain DSM 14429 / JCM 11212 / NBRC 100878 / IC-017) TaxID=572478 RepID=E1QQX4_VULDI|nr:DNA double-strand break repair nuclease NurA [Vulcanisaeta distributa]ADN50544.1 NurA domain protein [Vulcanisaeta distributa DSM 14429]